MRPYVDTDLVNIGLSNGLMPDGSRPLPKPMPTNHRWGPVAFSWEMLKTSIIDVNFRLQQSLPGANELNKTKGDHVTRVAV